MAAGTIKTKAFVVEEVRFPASGTVNANSYKDLTASCEKAGYTPIAVAGWSSANAQLSISYVYFSKTSATIRLINTKSNNINYGTPQIRLLYAAD